MLPAWLTRPAARVRRRLLIHRRPLAALLAASAVATGLHAVTPPDRATVGLTVAARDLPAGETLSAHDVTTARVPAGVVPDGAARAVEGEVLAAPLRRGEAITDARLVGPGLVTAAPGLVALPVRLPDGAMAGLLEPGDRVDLYAVAAGTETSDTATSGTEASGTEASGTAGSRTATEVAAGVHVLAVPPQKQTGTSVTSGLGGRLIVVGVPDTAVARVTEASVRSFLTFAFAS